MTPRLTTQPINPGRATRATRASRATRQGGGQVGLANSLGLDTQASSRAANARMLQRATSEFGPAPTLDLTDPQVQEVKKYVTDDFIRDYLDLAPDTDIDSLANNWAFIKAINPAAPARAQQLYRAINSPQMFEEIQTSRRTAVPHPISPESSKNNKQKALEALKRMGYGGSELEGDLPLPEFTPQDTRDPTRHQGPDGLPSIERKPSAEHKNIPISPADFGKTVGMGALLGIAKASEPLDVFAETTGELFAQAPKLLTDDFGELEAPTLFTDGYGAALQSFKDRPFQEQIALSILDPTILFGGGKLTAKILTGSLGRIAKKGTEEFAVEAARAELSKELFRLKEAGKLTDIVMLPSYQDILRSALPIEELDDGAIVAAKGAMSFDKLPGGKLVGKSASILRKAADPSSELWRLEPGSPDRIIQETSLAYKRAGVMTDALVEVVMSTIREKGDLKKLFGVADGYGEDAIKAPLVQFVDPKRHNEVPLFGNVFENRAMFKLTAEQHQWIEDVHKTLDEALQYWRAEGIDVKEVGALNDAFYYFPRQFKDEINGQLKTELFDARTGQRVGKHRVRDNMDLAFRNEGKRYAGPMEALAGYFKGGYAEVNKLRAQAHAGDLFKSQAIVKQYSNRVNIAANTGRVQTQTIRDLGHMARGFVPSTATKAAMKRAFPTLADSIDTITGFDAQEASEIISRVSGEVLRETGVSREKIRQIVDNLLVPTEPRTGMNLGELEADLVNVQRQRKAGTPDELAEGLSVDDGLKQLKDTESQIQSSIDKLIEQQAKLVTGEGAETTRDNITNAVNKLVGDAQTAARLTQELQLTTMHTLKTMKLASIEALKNRMKELRTLNIEELAAAREELKFASSRARTTGQTEGKGVFFQNAIYKDFGGKTGEEIANDLEKRLIDSGSALLKPFTQANAVLRSLKTVTDFGAPFIQGLPLLMRDPQMWGEVTKAHVLAFADPRVRSRYIAGNSREIVEMIQHGGTLGSSEFTEAMVQGGWLAKLPLVIDDVPVPLGPARPVARKTGDLIYATANRFGNSFETFLDMARIETWKSLRGSARNPRELDELASFVNKVTGTTSSRALGVSLTQQQFESTIPFFSPRYARATAALMMDALRGGLKGGEARKSLGALFFGMAAYHVAAQKALGQEIHLDPTKPGEFMKTQLGGQLIGPGSKPLSYMKSTVKMSAQAITHPERYQNWNVLDAQDYRDNKALSFLRNQSSITANSIISYATGSNALGRKMPGLSDPGGMATSFLRDSLPFSLDAALDAGNFKGALLAGGSEFVGLTAFAVPPFQELNNLYEKYSKQDYNMSYEQLQLTEDRGRQRIRKMVASHPDLKAAYDVSIDELRGRKLTADRVHVQDRNNEFRDDWVEQGRLAGENYLRDVESGELNPSRQMRISLRDAGRTRKDKRDVLEQEYPEVFKDLELFYSETSQKLLEDEGFDFLIAREEFYDRLTGPQIVDPATGRTNYLELDIMRENIDKEFGAGTMAKIDKYQQDDKFGLDLHPIHREFIAAHETLRSYWEIHKEIMPPDEWNAWRGFDMLPEGQKRQFGAIFAEKQGEIAVARMKLRQESYEIDRALHLVYGFAPVNSEYLTFLMKDLTNAP